MGAEEGNAEGEKAGEEDLKEFSRSSVRAVDEQFTWTQTDYSLHRRTIWEVTQFEPKLDVLPQAQRRLWNELSSVPPQFVLYGGTALALRLGHRTSEDFDFFSSTPFEPSTLQSHVAFLRDLSMSSFTQFKTNTLTAVVDRGGGVHVSFFGGLKLNRIEDPELAEGSVRLASLLDLAGTKAGTIYSRLASKDYLDLCALIEHGLSLATILGAGLAVYGSEYNPALTVRAMMCFDDLEGPALSDKQRKALSRAAASVQLNRIPGLTGRRGLSASKEPNENT